MQFKQALLRFLKDLDAVADKHPEICDPAVKEQMSESILYYVIHRQENGLRPVQYGMMSKAANEAIANAVNRFAEAAWNDPHYKLLTSSERLEELQNYRLETPKGNTIEEYVDIGESEADAINSIAEHRFKDMDAADYAQLTSSSVPAKPRYNIKVLYVSLVITLLIIAGIIYMITSLTPKG